MQRTFLLSALLIAAALPASAQSRRDRDEDYQSSIDTTFAFDKRGTVSLSLGSGEIVVRGWSRDQIQIRARSERSVIRMDATTTRVSLDLSRPRGGDTRFEVTVPIGVRVSARATNGDISITGTKGGVEAKSQSDYLHIEHVAEQIDLGIFASDLTASSRCQTINVS